MTAMLTIGQMAKAANVNVETVRYYQRRGLMHEPPKPVQGQRRYAQGDVNRLLFIKRAQMLGFTLDEIQQLLRLEAADCCSDTRNLAEHKLAVIEAKMADLSDMRNALKTLVRQCEVGDQQGHCPIIESLAHG